MPENNEENNLPPAHDDTTQDDASGPPPTANLVDEVAAAVVNTAETDSAAKLTDDEIKERTKRSMAAMTVRSSGNEVQTQEPTGTAGPTDVALPTLSTKTTSSSSQNGAATSTSMQDTAAKSRNRRIAPGTSRPGAYSVTQEEPSVEPPSQSASAASASTSVSAMERQDAIAKSRARRAVSAASASVASVPSSPKPATKSSNDSDAAIKQRARRPDNKSAASGGAEPSTDPDELSPRNGGKVKHFSAATSPGVVAVSLREPETAPVAPPLESAVSAPGAIRTRVGSRVGRKEKSQALAGQTCADKDSSNEESQKKMQFSTGGGLALAKVEEASFTTLSSSQKGTSKEFEKSGNFDLKTKSDLRDSEKSSVVDADGPLPPQSERSTGAFRSGRASEKDGAISESYLSDSYVANADGEVLVAAEVVDESKVDEEIKQRVMAEREALREEMMKDVAVGVVAVNDDDERSDCRCCICVFFLLIVGLVVGLSVGLSNRSNGAEAPVAPEVIDRITESPSAAPTSSDCLFCLDGVVPANLGGIVATQVPLRTCQDIYNDIQLLTIFDDECPRQQAEAAWRCGCSEFPPVPENATCKICPEGESPLPKFASDSIGVCIAASKWLSIIGHETSESECAGFRRLTTACECVEDVQPESLPPCTSDMTSIIVSETAVTDDSELRTYILCPDTVFPAGIFVGLNTTAQGGFIRDGQLPINVRSNAQILCGNDGSSANNCVIEGGSFGFLATNGWTLPGSVFLDNISLQGITFRNISVGDPASIGIYTIANATFTDCIFEDSTGPIVYSFPWILGSPSRRVLSSNRNGQNNQGNNMLRRVQGTEPGGHLGIVTFRNCIFRNNQELEGFSQSIMILNSPLDPTGAALPPDVAASTFELILEGNLFENNRGYVSAIYVGATAHVTMINNCFIGTNWERAPVWFSSLDLQTFDNTGNYLEIDNTTATDECALLHLGGECIGMFDREQCSI